MCDMYFYKLELAEHVQIEGSAYDMDAVTIMIISAPNDIDARRLALEREVHHKEGRNLSTIMFWGPNVDEQIQNIKCTLIGKSFIKEGIVATSELHATG